jgi:hypothetical protein
MVYTAGAVLWGEVVVKELVRVSIWLRTNNAPGRICLYNARAVLAGSGPAARPLHFNQVFIATSQVLIFHLIPPARDPLDYDQSEPNRKMQPVSVLIHNYRVDGCLRLSSRSDMGTFLEVTRETFSSLYDARITNLNNPAFGTISVPYVLVRQEPSVFTCS